MSHSKLSVPSKLSKVFARSKKNRIARGVVIVALVCMAVGMITVAGWTGNPRTSDSAIIPNLKPFSDPTGEVSTFNVAGAINTENPFFEDLGTNGRRCVTCHEPGDAFGLSLNDIQQRFVQTDGRDPLFAPVDGANCSNGKVGNSHDHSLLLNHGLIRIPLDVPANAQFKIRVVEDPYGCAMVTDPATGLPEVSVYRRPLPTTNLHFLSTVMFDGRETLLPLNNSATFMANLTSDLMHQSVDATLIHAQADVAPTTQQQQAIVNFELGLFTAQEKDNAAGDLSSEGATGGPSHLSSQPYYPGINDSLGADPSGDAFSSVVFKLFAPWADLKNYQGHYYDDRNHGYDKGFDGHGSPFPAFGRDRDSEYGRGDDQRESAAREAIADGETIFNTFPLTIQNVRGLNDNAALGSPVSFSGTCTTCHDAPNVGDHSLPLPLDIGTGHSAAFEHDPNIAAALTQLDFPNLPVYEISGCPDPFNGGQHASFLTTDPGKALISGLCSDFNRVKGPILRGLAARAPYFHNGAGANLEEVVNFYNLRFQMHLTEKQKSDLVAFLNSL